MNEGPTSPEQDAPITLLLVDDHPVVRKGTRDLLEGEPDLKVLGEAENGEDAIQKTRDLQPNVILMDVSMPGMNGIEATKRIKAEMPHVGVLVLTSYDDDAYVFALLEAGAAGYLLKNAREDELLGAVRAVAAGESALHPSVARKVLERFSTNQTPSPPEETLSPRELEVLRIAATGRTNKEIARDLDISPRTVQVHLANIFSKLGVGSRTEAVLYGIKRGWINPNELD
ncbi:response regulator [Deinococcus maricopensis]|uniref:Two component transcriptional regulator, LuxR family n=1 Tax=Deinococcus maricopensis (strain DSM 21211 / LMG 22137 / NRRL B-23946 / LB-34) TaxID=709986 RepID=E8U798_DEIML|nr:response regulator transcription factor [Deinococcus maricopensis]ADV66937.1 two component transcriptional regulator, LuxR family [Deinococcus maricopensis DSM 21211]